jgi:predicted RNA-binding Zn ribbon-like protein
LSRDPGRAATQFFGGRVCLDFANTLDWRTSAAPQELIPDYSALLAWSGRRGTLRPAALRRLGALAAARPAEAAAALAEAHALRAALVEAAERLLAGQPPALAPINRRLAALPAQPPLVRGGEAILHELPGDRLEQPLWPVLWSATALLTSADAARLGLCRADGCGWLFVDESPNRTRLWCSSEVCGNRERARRAYAKRRASD